MEESANNLSARQATIIEVVVRSYIDTGEPASSSEVASILEPSGSPATARNEMSALTEMGYLAQPHTSAGRIPTALAYRFVTEQMLARERTRSRSEQRLLKDPARIAEQVSEKSHAAAYVENPEGVGVAGFEYVLGAPELASEQAALQAFAHLVDALPRWANELHEVLDNRVGVFVAEENPIHPNGHFSIVATKLPGRGIAAVIGPIRMRYGVAIRTLANL